MNEEKLTGVAQSTPVQENPISAKLELCIDRMNTIHGRVDNIREKVSWEWQWEEALQLTTPNSIEWMVNSLFDNIVYLHEKIDIINERL